MRARKSIMPAPSVAHIDYDVEIEGEPVKLIMIIMIWIGNRIWILKGFLIGEAKKLAGTPEVPEIRKCRICRKSWECRKCRESRRAGNAGKAGNA